MVAELQKLMDGKGKVTPFLLFLFILFFFNVVLDGLMTDYALHGSGYYETNRFTNTFGVFAHGFVIILLFSLFAGFHVSYNFFYTKHIMIFFNCIWVLNNAFSIKMLWL